MKFFRHLKVYLALIAVIIVAVLLILNEYIIYGLMIGGVGFLGFSVWQLFVKRKEDEIADLESRLHQREKQNSALETENTELKNRKLNFAAIKNIADLGLMEVDANFTRTWNEKREHQGKNIHFIGALQVRIVAKYGIDLKEIRIKHNAAANTLEVGNVNPKFLSFNDLDYEWKIAEIMEYKQPWLGSDHWRKSALLDELCAQIKEDLRTETHQQVKNGPEELDWLTQPMRKQVAASMELLLGTTGKNVKLVDQVDHTFKAIEEM